MCVGVFVQYLYAVLTRDATHPKIVPQLSTTNTQRNERGYAYTAGTAQRCSTHSLAETSTGSAGAGAGQGARREDEGEGCVWVGAGCGFGGTSAACQCA
jgi:hypothetical protein